MAGSVTCLVYSTVRVEILVCGHKINDAQQEKKTGEISMIRGMYLERYHLIEQHQESPRWS